MIVKFSRTLGTEGSLNSNALTARNQVKWEIRKSVKERWPKILKLIPKASNSMLIIIGPILKTKPREIIPDLSNPDGTLTKTDHDKSEVLN